MDSGCCDREEKVFDGWRSKHEDNRLAGGEEHVRGWLVGLWRCCLVAGCLLKLKNNQER